MCGSSAIDKISAADSACTGYQCRYSFKKTAGSVVNQLSAGQKCMGTGWIIGHDSISACSCNNQPIKTVTRCWLGCIIIHLREKDPVLLAVEYLDIRSEERRVGKGGGPR